MRFTQKCPICGNTEISGPHIIDRVHLLNLRTSTINALTCLECGYTEQYADKKGLENMRKYGRPYKLPGLEDEYCPKCGANFQKGTVKCSKCGFLEVGTLEVIGESTPCENCSLMLDYGTHTCPACGFRKSES